MYSDPALENAAIKDLLQRLTRSAPGTSRTQAAVSIACWSASISWSQARRVFEANLVGDASNPRVSPLACRTKLEHRRPMDPQARLLRHFAAALAYRTQKALRGAPPEFASFRAASGSRTPHELVRHMSGVLNFALGRLTGPRALLETLTEFDAEVERLHEILVAISARLAEDANLSMTLAERLLQGPLADAMTHAGQLAMLRRLAGSPVPPEDFFEAAVSADNVDREQALPESPDDDWPEAPAGWTAPKRRP